jgi:hypothetical protein
MQVTRYERGAVVRCNNKTWIVWTYPKGPRAGNPIALPVMPQTGPRHRSHARFALGGRPVLVHLLDPVQLRHADCAFIGQCSDDIVSHLAESMRRAIQASTAEQRQVA